MSRSIIAPARPLNIVPYGIVAGLIGGAVIDLFLLATGMGHAPQIYQWIASLIVGPVAFSSAADAWLGVGLHIIVSAAWGVAYALLCQRIGTVVLDRPVVAGVAFGIVVWAVMQLVLLSLHAWQRPISPVVLLLSLIAHTLFFGVPIATFVRVAVRRRMPT